ncbi:MAG: PhzF family phenazine biosynthesis protein [Hyphomicrobiales bacterium]|nr:PhzF family phenazine biosynthesis protein [Hyphomicrobiales bacterium]
MTRRFFTLDVFTASALAGNPLAVVLDSEGLNDHAMQAIAREFNLSETVFVSPPVDARSRASLRIFTPGRELPFAGHPTVGTAVLLSIRDHSGQHGHVAFDLEEKIGLVPCSVEVINDGLGRAVFTLPRLPEMIGDAAHDLALAQAISLKPGDIGLGRHRPGVFSAGVGFTTIPVRGRDALARARPDIAHWSGIKPADHANAFVYTSETSDAGHAYRARMFAPGLGVGEDPATGSAVAAFAGAIMAFDAPDDGEHRLTIEQGYEMGRPSQIDLHLTVSGGELVKAAIGGSAVLVSEGQLHL